MESQRTFPEWVRFSRSSEVSQGLERLKRVIRQNRPGVRVFTDEGRAGEVQKQIFFQMSAEPAENGAAGVPV